MTAIVWSAHQFAPPDQRVFNARSAGQSITTQSVHGISGKDNSMARPVTLFTGQWADLPLEELCKKASEWGFDGLELACWGDHFEVDKALSDDTYCARRRELLEKYDLQLFSISNHLVGQAV